MSEEVARGRLVLVGTPIGNREDLSPRAARTILEADLLFCEDTRSPLRLFEADTQLPPRRSCFVGNEHDRVPELLDALGEGNVVAYVCEAGMPVWSDPGRLLVAAAREAGYEVDVVPGAVAACVALAASGFEAEGARFLGFIARSGSERRTALESLAHERGASLIYEAGNRVPALLRDLASALPDAASRRVLIGRELTKKHQEFIEGEVEALAGSQRDALRGEVVVVVQGVEGEKETSDETNPLRAMLDVVLDPTLKPRARAKKLAALSGGDAKEIYDGLVALANRSHEEPGS